MNEAFKLARAYGVAIAFADLGDWGPAAQLRSEYDPQGPTIRINTRMIETLATDELGEFLTLAVGHELYHHREHRGEIEKLADRQTRERSADAFARELLASA